MLVGGIMGEEESRVDWGELGNVTRTHMGVSIQGDNDAAQGSKKSKS